MVYGTQRFRQSCVLILRAYLCLEASLSGFDVYMHCVEVFDQPFIVHYLFEVSTDALCMVYEIHLVLDSEYKEVCSELVAAHLRHQNSGTPRHPIATAHSMMHVLIDLFDFVSWCQGAWLHSRGTTLPTGIQLLPTRNRQRPDLPKLASGYNQTT